MTTLPQTTPMRVTRPAGGNGGVSGMPLVPGMPGLAGGLAQAAPAPGLHLSPGDVWRIVRSNLWLLVVLLVVAGVAGWLVNKYLEKYHSRFTATGLIQVQPPSNPNPLKEQAAPSYYGIVADQRTQVQLLRQESLVSKILQNPKSEIRNTSWFNQFPKEQNITLAKQDLLKNFSAGPVPDTRLIAVSFSCSIPNDCKTVVEDLVTQHLDDQRQNIKNKQYDRSVLLNNMKVRFQARLRDIGQELREKAVRLGSDGGIGTQGLGRWNFKEHELTDHIERRTQIQLVVTAAQSALDKALTELQQGQDPPRVVDAVEQNEDVKQLRQELRGLEIALADTKEQWGSAHPQYQRMEKRLEVIKDRLHKTRAEQLAALRSKYIEGLRDGLSESQRNMTGIDKRIDELKTDISEYSHAMATYLTLQDEEKGLKELLKQVQEQLDDIATMEQTEMGNLAWVTKPPMPDTPSFPVFSQTMSTALVMALVLWAGIAGLRELLDTTVRSPRDVTRVGQINLLGVVPHEDDDPQSAGARLPLVIFDAPHSILAEHFRHIRTRLQHAASLDTTRSIMITAPSPRDGKTTVACNLASGLALNGRRILLVDADFRRPEVHKIFGMANDVGFSSVLTGQVQFKDAVQESPVPNLSVMTAGPKPPNATELFESQVYTDFLERACEEFDHVLFDSGPLMVVSESFAMAPRVDGVVTVVRAHKDTRGILARMRDTLRQVKAEHLGLVLNAVRAHGGGYYGRNIKTYYAYERGQA
ncbi:MAG: polysaccharide biosynthesis tyrosine autokinase [Tepidisphaeraceae bacterium]